MFFSHTGTVQLVHIAVTKVLTDILKALDTGDIDFFVNPDIEF